MDLSSKVGELSFVGPIYKRRLEKLEIYSIEDLLNHVPRRYLDFSLTSNISSVFPGEILTVKGEITSIKNQYTHSGRKIQIATVADGTGEILAVWFNQPFLVRVLYPGAKVALAGKVDWFGRKKAFLSPEYERLDEGKKGIHTGRIIPVYPETSGVSSKWLRGRVKEAFIKTGGEIKEFLPERELTRLNLIDITSAYNSIHFPTNISETEKGRKRLAFNELLFLQLASSYKKSQWKKNKASYKLEVDKREVQKFIYLLPFELTSSQKKSVEEILTDLKKEYPMNRLLEGDVGSGKTVVATTAAFTSFLNGYQSVFMAPTQILAQQHFNTLNNLLQPFKVRISLITSDAREKDLGRCDIFIGTHALIHQKVGFDKVALVVIDEQHRFGVEQREHLVRKSKNRRVSPHVLTMTATPIPRTVALTFYGELDLSTLNELPKGRAKVTTWIVPPQKREKAYSWMEEKIKKEKIQIFIVCPLIEESQVETTKDVKAVKKEYEKLKKVFKNLRVGLLHGKQSGKEKNKVLELFREGVINILVSTPVVEVGIDVPNATIMVIEGAERFGLAQLHQLRGRVGRSDAKSYCLLFTESKSQKVLTRITALTKSMSGFELAELDLKLRGPGEIFGTRQHGFPELKIASWGDIDLIKKTRDLAEKIFENPKKYKDLVGKMQKLLHIA